MSTALQQATLQLPTWTEPSSLTDAKMRIESLGKNLHQYAYTLGKTLLWVKKQVGHGKFIQWVKDNVWFSERTARRFVDFARRCDGVKHLLEYHPNLTDTVAYVRPRTSPGAVTVTALPSSVRPTAKVIQREKPNDKNEEHESSEKGESTEEHKPTESIHKNNKPHIDNVPETPEAMDINPLKLIEYCGSQGEDYWKTHQDALWRFIADELYVLASIIAEYTVSPVGIDRESLFAWGGIHNTISEASRDLEKLLDTKLPELKKEMNEHSASGKGKCASGGSHK